MLEIAGGLIFGESLLTRRHKEMMATYLSRQNACSYCADGHGALLGELGGSLDLICALQQSGLDPELFTGAEVVLLRFAGQVNANTESPRIA